MNHIDAPAIIDELYTSLQYVRISPSVNSRAKLVTPAPGSRLEGVGSRIKHDFKRLIKVFVS